MPQGTPLNGIRMQRANVIKQWRHALIRTGGNTTNASLLLGRHPSACTKFLETHPTLRAFQRELQYCSSTDPIISPHIIVRSQKNLIGVKYTAPPDKINMDDEVEIITLI